MPSATQKTYRCRTETCRAEIVWVTLIKLDGSTAAKKHPVDAAPVPAGNLEYLRGAADAPVLRALTDEQQAQPGEHDRYVSHFKTCPAAEAWRAKHADRPGAARRRAGRTGAGR